MYFIINADVFRLGEANIYVFYQPSKEKLVPLLLLCTDSEGGKDFSGYVEASGPEGLGLLKETEPQIQFIRFKKN